MKIAGGQVQLGTRVRGIWARLAELAREPDVRITSAILVVFVGVRLYAFLAGNTIVAGDTGTYTAVADASGPFDPSFYSARRPFVLPLLYELVGSQTGWAVAQWLIATGAWIAFAFVVSSALHSRAVRFAALGAILAFSLTQAVATWDRALLTESLTISLGILLFSAVALLLRGASPGRLAFAAIVLVLFVFARDANAPASTLLLLLLAVPLLLAHRRALAAGFVAMAIATLVASQLSANAGKRWEFSMMNVIGARVLPTPDVRDYFVDHGMPYDIATRSMSGYVTSSKNYALFHNRPLMAWMRSDGRRVYATFLATHPGYLTYWPATDQGLLAGEIWNDFKDGGLAVLPEPVEAIVFPSGAGRGLFLVAVALAAAAAAVRYRRREWLVPLAILVATPPYMAFVWHADYMEVPRHALFLGVAFRLAALWLLLLVADAVWPGARREAGPPLTLRRRTTRT